MKSGRRQRKGHTGGGGGGGHEEQPQARKHSMPKLRHRGAKHDALVHTGGRGHAGASGFRSEQLGNCLQHPPTCGIDVAGAQSRPIQPLTPRHTDPLSNGSSHATALSYTRTSSHECTGTSACGAACHQTQRETRCKASSAGTRTANSAGGIGDLQATPEITVTTGPMAGPPS